MYLLSNFVSNLNNMEIMILVPQSSLLFEYYGVIDTMLVQAASPDGFINVNLIEIIYGCMDTTAVNYNPQANDDDGSCQYIPPTPSDFTVLSDIVETYIRKNNFEDAKKILKDFAEKYPDNYKSYFKLGQLYESMGEFKKAKEQHEIASLIEPNINDITLAKIETKFGGFDLAVNKLNELYESPNRTNEGKYNILRALSDIYYKIGKVEKSIESSEEGYKLEPT